jgi:hypothetical protein
VRKHQCRLQIGITLQDGGRPGSRRVGSHQRRLPNRVPLRPVVHSAHEAAHRRVLGERQSTSPVPAIAVTEENGRFGESCRRDCAVQ